MDFLLGLLVLFFTVPLVTAHAAKQYGRSFWAWFGIGCLLPAISLLILAMLPDLAEDKKNETSSLPNSIDPPKL
jgi:hypothetical protein